MIVPSAQPVKDKKSGFAARLRRARSYFRFSLPMCISTNGRKICTGIISIFLFHRDAVSYEIKKIAQYETRSMTNMIEHLIKREITRYEKENGEISVNEEKLYLE